jgi:hypothetical protein
MDEQENAYLKQQIREIDRARRLWKAIALSLVAAGVLFLVFGMGSMASYDILRTRSALQRERQAAIEAQMQAERARAAEMAARVEADKIEKERGQKGK